MSNNHFKIGDIVIYKNGDSYYADEKFTIERINGNRAYILSDIDLMYLEYYKYNTKSAYMWVDMDKLIHDKTNTMSLMERYKNFKEERLNGI